MRLLEERIKKDGLVLAGDVLKVDSFLNHQIDIELMDKIGAEFARLFAGCGATRIVTIEASGIAAAALTALHMGLPLVYAKKSASSNVGSDVYSAPVWSYTHSCENNVIISRRFISPEDKVLIIDDFLAHGNALRGLISICRDCAGAEVVGAGVCIEKAYQNGGDRIRTEDNIRVESLARIASMNEKDGVTFLP